MNKYIASILLIVVLLSCVDCKKGNDGTDDNVAVPKGDPPFPPLTTSWIIDNVGVIEKDTAAKCNNICQKMKDDGIAEVVVLIQNGVKHPSDYATHYGRWLKLGAKGLSTEGGNNGLVWLIRPDADEKMTYSIGRGLPMLTSSRMVDVMNKAKEYLNFNNYDKGISVIVEETEKQLLEIRKGERK